MKCSPGDDKTQVNVIIDTPLSDFVIAPTISSAADDIKPVVEVKNELPVLRPLATSGDSDCCTDSQKNGSGSAVIAKDFAAVLRHKMGQLEVPADKLVSAEARSLLLSLAREHLAPVTGTGLDTLVSQFLAANPCDNTNELLMLVSEGDTRLDSLAGALILEAGGGGLNADARKVFSLVRSRCPYR